MRALTAFLIALTAALAAALPAGAADSGWTGQWNTRWRDGGARMELQQQGTKVTGAYPAYGGTIEGEVRGRELQGSWTEGPRTGGITFVAGILVADRPFRRGDWIEAGDAKGTVEHVGIRSTRIRTGDDSLMFVPNGKLSDATVNNLGTRRHRVTKARLLVPHGTPPDMLAAFLRDLDNLASRSPQVKPGSVQVGVGALGPDGVEVDLACCLDVRAAPDERAARTTLMLDVLRLADRMGIRLGQDAPAVASMAAAA